MHKCRLAVFREPPAAVAYSPECPKSSSLVRRPDFCDKTEVRQFWPAVHEDNILRLDVTMSQSLPVEKIKRVAQFNADTYALLNLKPSSPGARKLAGQVTRLIR